MTEPLKIDSFVKLFEVLENSQYVREFFILLNGNIRSWKQLCLSDKKDRYGRWKIDIYNEIDESRQTLTYSNIMSPKYSNIASAIQCGAFYLYDDNENNDFDWKIK